jgi:cardiolipin synthase
MVNLDLNEQSPASPSSIHMLAAQAFSRAAGAPLVTGNSIRLLKDAEENYSAWFEAIGSAQHVVHFENYIVYDDEIGYQLADALIAKAQEGVRVRLLYDWFGGLMKTSRSFWRRLRDGGVEVRCFNPPRFDSPLGWLSRDHRKSLCVDNRIAFVSGLCIGQMWVGYPERGIAPWRDTGVEVRGPAVADVAQAFARAWVEAGPALPADELPSHESISKVGDVSLRVVASMPAVAGLYRLDQLIAGLARQTLWLTDAYFVGATGYVQALRGAAMDGVDVRLLVPGANDIGILAPITRGGYRTLLDAGVRVFEWNGPMLHAKTAVTDGRWARVGSSNLNMASWLGNWELDIAVEDEAFADEMEDMYLQDLDYATEIVLNERNRVRPIMPRERRPIRRRVSGSTGRFAASAMRVGNTVGAAITNRRALGAAEAKTMLFGSLVLLAIAAAAALWPLLIVVPVASLAIWLAIALLIKAYRLRRGARTQIVSDSLAKEIEISKATRDPSNSAQE